jgi:hypothetical protein
MSYVLENPSVFSTSPVLRPVTARNIVDCWSRRFVNRCENGISVLIEFLELNYCLPVSCVRWEYLLDNPFDVTDQLITLSIHFTERFFAWPWLLTLHALYLVFSS